MAGTWAKAAALADFAGHDTLAVTVAGRKLGLFHVGDQFFAIDNICTHGQAMLSEGVLEDEVIECPLHAGLFDVRTGRALGAPALRDVASYPVRIDGEAIMVLLPEAAD
ncbi:MAG TPA: non-heme iron oxygenase ferredoxin subunit [Candidatus Binataceae bacterium]|nr:non-heme iron oxygenase ferredoxin subunit [Candidatus Binataceae bacterium]